MDRRGRVAAVLMLLVVFGLVAVVARWSESTRPDVVGFGSWAGARTANGGRDVILSLVVHGGPYRFDDPCSADLHVRVTETRSDVRLRISAVAPPDPSGLRRRRAGGCGEHLYRRMVTAHLGRPLGGRSLLDDRSRRRQPVYDDARLATPTWMPAGWHLQYEAAVTDPSKTTITGWTRFYAPDRVRNVDSCVPSDEALVLTQSATSTQFEEGEGHDDVHGETAVYSAADPTQPHLVWQERGQTFEIDAELTCEGDNVPTKDIILHFARALDVPEARP